MTASKKKLLNDLIIETNQEYSKLNEKLSKMNEKETINSLSAVLGQTLAPLDPMHIVQY
jgi:hypothetical protein